MATFTTYEMNGQKLSFANWISNLSPSDTPFLSMTGKEKTDQTKFQWQVDRLSSPAANAQLEGDVAPEGVQSATVEKENYTQIFRRVIKVTDVANKIGLYGRQNELSYQMEKASIELKRDMEAAFLSAQAGTIGSTSTPRQTSGFEKLVADVGVTDPDTGASVNKAGTLDEEHLWSMAYNLYLAGSKANTIMFHPEHMPWFSSLAASKSANRHRLFENLETKVNLHVKSIRSPLGQEFVLVPNRFMPKNTLYFFNPSDWSQMVLAAPERTELAKTGAASKWMIETEIGLRHRNPFASGVYHIVPGTPRAAAMVEDAPVVKAKKKAAK